jgi:Tfp pilus assembly protein PilN
MRELNLIPYELKEKEVKFNKKKQITLVLILAGLIVFSLVYFPMAYSSIVKGKETRLKNEADSKKYVLEEYNQVQTSISTIKAHIDIADGIDKSKVYVNKIIDKLSLLTPGAVSFTNITYQNGAISINSESKDYNSIFEFAANLETSEDFGTAKLSTVTYNKDKANYTFNLTIPQKEAVKK